MFVRKGTSNLCQQVNRLELNLQLTPHPNRQLGQVLGNRKRIGEQGSGIVEFRTSTVATRTALRMNLSHVVTQIFQIDESPSYQKPTS